MANNVNKLNKDRLLINLMLTNHITLSDAYHCAEQQMDRINNMMDIFEHDNDEDKQRLVLELLGLLAQDKRSEVISYYSKEYDFDVKPDSNAEDVKLLLSACIYNPSFFSFALSICEFVRSKLSAAKPIAEGVNVIPFRKPIFQDHLPVFNAASPEGFKIFIEKPMDIDNNISGTFYFMGNTYKQVILEFVFNEAQEKIPFELEFCFTAKDGGEEKRIIINLPKPGENSMIIGIRSDLEKNIDFAGGLNYTIYLMTKE